MTYILLPHAPKHLHVIKEVTSFYPFEPSQAAGILQLSKHVENNEYIKFELEDNILDAKMENGLIKIYYTKALDLTHEYNIIQQSTLSEEEKDSLYMDVTVSSVSENLDELKELFAAYSDEKKQEIRQQFNKLVNMSKSECEAWKENECSKMASLSVAPLNRVIALLDKKSEEWQNSDYRNANRVISFISRMTKVKNGKPVKTKTGKSCASKRDISLKNWGHDPAK